MRAAPQPSARTGFYYGWVLAVSLGVAAATSYGVLSYAFAVFIVPMSDELGWSPSSITGAYSLALLVAAAAAVPVGRCVDRYGARGIMTAGGVLGATGLLVWSGVSSHGSYYAVAALLGLSMAMLFYEPAFAVMATWFERRRTRALTVLTLLGGLASITFIPLAAVLVEAYGWRSALQRLALVLAAVTIPLHGLLLRRRPEDLGLRPDGAGAPPERPAVARAVPGPAAVGSRSFVWLATAFALHGIVSTAIAVHLIPLLLERGEAIATAGFAMGTVGLMAVPGRLAIAPLADRVPSAHIASALVALQAFGLLVLLCFEARAGIWLFVALFGAGSGALTPVRAALQAELYGSERYGAIGGALAMTTAVARAAAPVGASLLLVAAGSYDIVLGVLLALVAASGFAILVASATAAARAEPAHLAST